MIKTYCPICGPKVNYKVLYNKNFDESLIDEKIFSARRMPDRIHYGVVKCCNCGLIYSNPILKEEKIAKLYKKSSLIYEKEINDLKETYGSYLKKIIPFLKSKDNILEIGCGNGFFLQKALELGFKNAYGVEPSAKAVKSAKPEIQKNIITDVLKENLFKNDFFDIICFFQTFDHIINPNEFLKICYDYLKKDGLVLAINHNIGGWLPGILGEKCPMIDIEHTCLYDKSTFRKIFEKNNFQVKKIFDVKNNYPLAYWVKLAPVPNIVKKIFSWKMKVKINAGNMGILAVK